MGVVCVCVCASVCTCCVCGCCAYICVLMYAHTFVCTYVHAHLCAYFRMMGSYEITIHIFFHADQRSMFHFSNML